MTKESAVSKKTKPRVPRYKKSQAGVGTNKRKKGTKSKDSRLTTVLDIPPLFEYDVVEDDPISTLRNIGEGRQLIRSKITTLANVEKERLQAQISEYNAQLKSVQDNELDALDMIDDMARVQAAIQEDLFAGKMDDFTRALATARDITNCTICQQPLDGPTCVSDIVSLHCDHRFHKECVSKLIKITKFGVQSDSVSETVTCPNCNREHTFVTKINYVDMTCREEFLDSHVNGHERNTGRGTPGFWSTDHSLTV